MTATPEDLPKELREKLEELVAQVDPAFLAKFGNPLDPNDARHWKPSERKERGVSIEDRLAFLELDMESMQSSFARVMEWIMTQQEKEYQAKIAELVSNPEKAREFMEQLLGPAARGPEGDHGPAYAGSTRGIQPDELVDTVDGPIRADQIPGYRNDPDWKPSPDWADANCTCPAHVAAREAAGDPGREERPPGMYL